MFTQQDLETVINYAFSFTHTPYRWGGNTSLTGIDCSGFVCEVLRAGGVLKNKEDLNAQALYDRFSKANFGIICIQGHPGCLCFYGKSTTEITHVAFCLTPTRVIEAGGGDSKTTTLDDAKARGAMVRVRRIDYRGDLVAIVRPAYV